MKKALLLSLFFAPAYSGYFDTIKNAGYHSIVITQEFKDSAQFCAKDKAGNRVIGEIKNNIMETRYERDDSSRQIPAGNLFETGGDNDYRSSEKTEGGAFNAFIPDPRVFWPE